MSWHHLSTNSKAIDHLYADAPPTLDACTLAELRLHEDGPTLTLVVHIAQMPEKQRWPKRWHADANRVAIELSFIGLRRVTVDGWCLNNVGSVDLRRGQDDPDTIEVIASGSWGKVLALCEFLYIARVQEYQVDLSAAR